MQSSEDALDGAVPRLAASEAVVGGQARVDEAKPGKGTHQKHTHTI
jgi:hypothetical protein